MKIKQSIICKGIDHWTLDTSLNEAYQPVLGDVALFEVEELGMHRKMQCVDGKIHDIYPGDLAMMAFGSRYASSQLHGTIPSGAESSYHILGQGGVCGIIESFHARFTDRGPTSLKMLGFITGQEKSQVNTRYFLNKRCSYSSDHQTLPPIILSLGGSMDSGKTTSAGHLCRGLKKANKKVAFIKLTGTVFSKDVDFVVDCGADMGIDFSHCGYPSTYLMPLDELADLFQTLVNMTLKIQPDFIVMEVADGLFQRETNYLLLSRIMEKVASVIYSDSSSTGALSGVRLLQSYGINPVAISGKFTASPLLIDEVKTQSHIPVLNLEDLENENVISLHVIENNKTGKMVKNHSFISSEAI